MNKIALSDAATSARPKLRRHYFSAGLGLACSLATNPASAHDASQHLGVFGGSPPTLTPHSISSSSASGQSGLWTSFAVHGAATQVSGNSFSAGKGYNGTVPRSQRAVFTLPASPDSLDLGSNQSNFSLSGLSNVQTLTISVGGKSEVVNLSTKLTGAELLAADQVLAGGHQTLTINAAGEATGGVFTLSSQSLTAIDTSLGGLNALSVPHNVRIVDTISSLQLPGDLINSGHIVTQPGAGNTSTIQALDIINTAGASITGSASPNGQGANLTLIADHQLVNNGLILAANNLTITTPSLVNTGVIKATGGDVNFNSSSAAAINNTAGTISALQGNINVNTATSNGNVDINGGNLLSNQLNINAGTGDVNVNVGNLTGVVNVDACSAHVNATTADLQLGTLNVSGDPTYYNQGNITITGAMAPTDGQALAIIASGNILSKGGTLNTANGSIIGSGGAITLVAGANFTTSDNSTSGSNNTTTTLTITYGPGSGGGSISGGLIDLSGGHGGSAPVTAITTAGGAIGSAGSVTMLAFAGKGASTGTVTLPQSLTLNTGTGGFGDSGNVTIIAGATKGTAISVGNIDTSSGKLGQGNIQLAAAQPPITGPVTILDGAITSGSFTGIIPPTNASITTGNLTTGGGDVNISCKGTITFNNINTSGQGGTASTGNPGTNGGGAGLVSLQSFGNISGNNILAYGGGGGGGSVNGNTGTDGGNGGNGGTVVVNTNQGTVTIKGMIDTSGGGGGGGGGTGYNGAAGSAGDGGMGGTAADVTITALKSCTVIGGIFSVAGAFGGGGGLIDAINDAGSGGGGGASYGGGGGGGAAGNTTAPSGGGAGGGGGGGLYGGGGGSGVAFGGTANLGGSGGGFQTPGAGGTGGAGSPAIDNGLDGTKLSGGNGAGASVLFSTGLGGSLGFGGLGGSGAGALTNGSNGVNVVVANTLSSGGGTLTITTSSGTVGTQKAPLTTLVQTLDLATSFAGKIPTNSFYINNGADLVTSFGAFGAVSIKAEGDITLVGAGGNIAGTTLVLTTAPGNVAGSGNININSGLNSETATLQAGGAGAIQTMAGQHLLANNLTLVSGSGAIGSFGNPLSIEGLKSKVSANTNGDIFITSQFNLTLDQSSSGQNSVNVVCNGNLTVAGSVTAPSGNVILSSSSGIMLEANVSAPTGAVVLTGTGSANITEKNFSINTPTVFVGVDDGTVGTAKNPFKTDATNVNVDCNVTGNGTEVYITDTNTAMTSVANQGNPGFIFNVISSASQLSVKAGQFIIFNISDVSKTGSIVFTGPTGNDGDSTVTTVGGSVTQASAADVLDAISLNFKSTSGSFGTAAAPITLTDPTRTTLTFNTGKSATASFAENLAALDVTASTAGTVVLGTSTLADMKTTIEGAIKATTSVTITDGGTALTQQSGATISANNVTLTNTGNIVADGQIKASTVTLTSTAGAISYASVIGLGTGAVNVTAVAGGVIQTNSAGLLSGTSVSLSAVAIVGSSAVNVATPSLTINTSAGDAVVNVIGNTVLQNSGGIGSSLTLTSNGTVTEAASADLVAVNNLSISAKSFIQLAPGGAGGAVLGAAGALNITTTGSGNTIDIEGEGVVGVVRTTLITAPTATLTIGSNSKVVSPTLRIQTGTLTNKGSITSDSILTITNPTGNLLITNTGSISAPTTLVLNSGGNLTVTDTSNMFTTFQNVVPTTTGITITAKGALTLPMLSNNNELLVAANAANNGGSIIISAGSIVYPTGGLFFDASASTQAATMGNGGTISITITGKQNITADASPGWGFSDTGGPAGGNGGNVSISTGGSIFVSQADDAINNTPLATGFTGGNISLSAGSNLAISGALNSGFNGTETPGAVTLISNGKTPFLIDPAITFTSKSNGVTSIAGSVVQITNMAGVNVGTGGSITANTSLLVTTSEFTNNGTLMGTADIVTVTNPTGNLNITSPVMWNGLGSLIDLTLNSAGNLNTGSLFQTIGVIPDIIDLTSKGTLTLGANVITVGQFFGVGGIIDVKASQLAYSIQTPAPLFLIAQGNNSTGGGTVDLTLTGKAPVTLSSSGVGNIDIIVSPTNATPVAGGNVDVSTGGNLTVNLSGLQTNQPASTLNANVTLQSGGALLITGWNTSVIGSGGTLVTSDNNSKGFIIGSPTTSGINTSGAQIIGATLSITNTSGSVTIGGMDLLDATNLVTVVAGKNIEGTGTNEAIEATTVDLTSTGGMIGLGPNGATTPALFVSAASLSANAGKGSSFVSDDLAGTVTLAASSAKVFYLTTPQTLVVSGAVNASQVNLSTANGSIFIVNSIGSGTGTVTLNAGQTGLMAQSAGTINATTLSLSATNITNLQTNVSQLTATVMDSLSINNTGSKLLTINSDGLQAGGGNATVTAAGALTQVGTADAFGTVTYNAGGAITVNGKILGTSASLNASNGGTVTEGKLGAINCINLTLTSDTGALNSGKGSLAAQNLVIGTSGSVILTDSLASAADITVASIASPVASFTLNATTTSGNNLFLNNISTSNGSISVIYNGGILNTQPGAQLLATNGNITLQNTLASTGNIFLSPGTNIYASATAASLGNVNLFVGPAPKTPTVGTTPSNITQNFSGKGIIFYNQAGGVLSFPLLPAGTPNSLSALGRNIDLSSTVAGGIVIDGNGLDGIVTITADPPAPGSSAAVIPMSFVAIANVTPAGAQAPALPVILGQTSGGALISIPAITSMPITPLNWSMVTTNPNLIQNGGLGLSLDLGTTSSNCDPAADCTHSPPSSPVGVTRLSKKSEAQSAQIQDTRDKVTKILGDEAFLIAPDVDTIIESKFGTVELKSKCLVLIVSTEKCLTIFNLDDRQSGSVVARAGSANISLEPGRHLTISDSKASSFAKINPAQFVAHRRMSVGKIGEFKTFKSEFQVVSAISSLKQLREFMNSGEPTKQQAAKHLLKTAAILDGLSQGSSEQFELYSENLVTAMNRY